MKIQCPSCGFCSDVDDSKIPIVGKTARCPKCKASFVVSLPALSQQQDNLPKLCCPKCRLEQDPSNICKGCGLVFSKYIPPANHSALAASSGLARPQVQREPADASTSIEKTVKILLGFASAIILSIPIAALLLYSLSKLNLISNAGDIGVGVLFIMLFTVTHTMISLYGSAISCKDSIRLDLSCLKHVIAVIIISQVVVGGGVTFRLVYAVYAVMILFFASFVMFFAKRFTAYLIVISSIVLLGLIYHEQVSKKFTVVKATITGHDIGYYKNIVQSLERKQVEMPPGHVMSEKDLNELRRAKEKLKELQ